MGALLGRRRRRSLRGSSPTSPTRTTSPTPTSSPPASPWCRGSRFTSWSSRPRRRRGRPCPSASTCAACPDVLRQDAQLPRLHRRALRSACSAAWAPASWPCTRPSASASATRRPPPSPPSIMVTTAVLNPLLGRLGDRRGHKAVLTAVVLGCRWARCWSRPWRPAPTLFLVAFALKGAVGRRLHELGHAHRLRVLPRRGPRPPTSAWATPSPRRRCCWRRSWAALHRHGLRLHARLLGVRPLVSLATTLAWMRRVRDPRQPAPGWLP